MLESGFSKIDKDGAELQLASRTEKASPAGKIKHILKRNGVSVPFDRTKIWNAIKKAFYSLGYTQNAPVDKICEDVVSALSKNSEEERPPRLEEIQDTVETSLMRHGYVDVAKSYILYRAEHKRMRESRVVESINKHELRVIDDKGDSHIFDRGLLHDRFSQLAGGLKHVSTEEVLELVCKGIYNGVRLKEIDHLAIKEVEYKMEEHYDYGFFGARLILDNLYRQILHRGFGTQELRKTYADMFKEYVHLGIQEEMLSPKLAEFDHSRLAQSLDPKNDLLFNYLGIKTLEDRYLLKTRHKDETKKRIFELPQWMWMRVAMGLALGEEDKEGWAIEFYRVLSSMHFVSSTPTLFNSGTNFPQLSSCYINLVDDSLSGIFKNFSDDAQLSKWAGGIGTDWSGVRATGAAIVGTNGASSGIIPFIKIFNDIAIAVNQGGKRRGAMAAYLENWHLDIEEFLELKKNTGDERRRAHDIHPAVFISDLFMKRVQEDGMWTLMSPDDARILHESYGKDFEKNYLELEKTPPINHRVIRARDLWRKMLTMLYETGHPWITYKDAINVRSPQDHVGMVHSSNLCTEITLNTSPEETAVCNLGSINLAKMVDEDGINERKIEQTVKTAVRMLDNVIDINFYPTEEARRSNLKHRPIGLGMMGYHDALMSLRIKYSSDAQVDFADKTMELISYFAIEASADLSKEKGHYSSYEGSKWSRGVLPVDTLDLLEEHRGEKIEIDRAKRKNWDELRKKVKKQGMRNSNCMAIAPTATISNIAGVVPCVEPIYKNIYMKENLSGNFFIINSFLIDRLMELGIWSRDIIDEIKLADGSILGLSGIPQHVKEEFREVFEIDQRWIVRAAGARAKWLDQSASTNLFIDTRRGREINDIYFLAWKMGLKTTYYLRTRAASQITKTVGEDKHAESNTEEQTGSVVPDEQSILPGNTADNGTPKFNSLRSTPLTQAKQCSLQDPDCEACQ